MSIRKDIVGFRDGSPISQHPESVVHTCDTQHPDDPTACAACIEEDPPMLVCNDCGEAFDDLVAAVTHLTTDPDGLIEACGESYRIEPTSSAL